jgi:hypothetical protein
MIARTFVTFVTAIVLVAGFVIAGNFALAAGSQSDFAPGQMWSVKGSSAKVIVVRVEQWHDRIAVHISIIDIPAPPDLPWLTKIGHMPFDKDALAASVDQLVANDVKPVDTFDGGYENWKDAKGGIFTISVAEAIETMFTTVRKGTRQPT